MTRRHNRGVERQPVCRTRPCWGLHTERPGHAPPFLTVVAVFGFSRSLSLPLNYYSDRVGVVLGHSPRRGRRAVSSQRRGRALKFSAPSADGHAHQLLLALPKIHRAPGMPELATRPFKKRKNMLNNIPNIARAYHPGR